MRALPLPRSSLPVRFASNEANSEFQLILFFFRSCSFPVDPPYEHWKRSELQHWLISHSVAAPIQQLSNEQLRDLVKQHYVGAYARWSHEDIEKWIAANPRAPIASATNRESAIGSIRRYYDSAFEKWEAGDLRGFLADHGIVEPHEPTKATLLDTVRSNWDRVRNYATDLPQAIVDETADTFDYSSSSDSQLRAYLLGKGIISPASSREQLLLQVQQMKNRYATGVLGHNFAEATDSVSSGVSRVSSAVVAIPSVVGEAATASFYSAVEAPALAYDYVSGVLHGSSFSSSSP